jgi:hypothetical protein
MGKPMKITEARDIMRRQCGYRVHFDEKREGGMLYSDYFPERDEPPIADLEDAWRLAEQWAAVDPSLYVNIYVTHAHDWTPVEGYTTRELNKYPKLEVQ